MVPFSLSRYLQKRSIIGPWRLAGHLKGPFLGAVIIPSLAEGESLFATLASLSRNPPELLARFPVIVVVNHRKDSTAEDREQNLRDLERLAAGDFPSELRLGWVDAATRGMELPVRTGGVGLARKIGCDLALPHLDFADKFEPVLVWLDADTLVDSNYLPALCRHFASSPAGGAVLPFVHRPGSSPAEQEAINLYELFLRHYVLGLTLAGSPYAFHTVGSATACRASAYVRAGGMNRRRAGEDFYFLQHLAKTDGVAQVRGTVVRPASRPSGRVPFGTGAAVTKWLDGGRATIRFYAPECFLLLSRWLAITRAGWLTSAADLLGEARGISEHLEDFLREENLESVWPKLADHGKRRDRWTVAFHGWFDGLKTLRLIHRLSRDQWPMGTPEEALPRLFDWAGLPQAREVGDQLKQLRRCQMGRSSNGTDRKSFM